MLMKRALLWVRNRNIPRACMYCLAENQAVRRMARHVGMAINTYAGDSEGEVALPRSTPLSIAREFAAEQAGLLDYLLKTGLASATPGAAPSSSTPGILSYRPAEPRPPGPAFGR
jgi:hypothetical protein